jgi:hypothetical protein
MPNIVAGDAGGVGGETIWGRRDPISSHGRLDVYQLDMQSVITYRSNARLLSHKRKHLLTSIVQTAFRSVP